MVKHEKNDDDDDDNGYFKVDQSDDEGHDDDLNDDINQSINDNSNNNNNNNMTIVNSSNNNNNNVKKLKSGNSIKIKRRVLDDYSDVDGRMFVISFYIHGCSRVMLRLYLLKILTDFSH